MKVLSDLVVIIEALNDISLAITIKIGELGNHIAASYVDLAIDNLDAQWLEKPRANTLPRKCARALIDTIHDPYVAIPCADGGAFATFEKVDTRSAHP